MSAMASSDRPVERVEVPHDVALPADEPIPRPIPIRMPVVSQAAAIEPPRVRTDPPIRLAAFSNSRPVEPRPAPKPAVAAIVDRPAALPASLAAEPIPAATVPVAVPAAVPAVLPRAEAIPPPARPPAPESAVQTVLARYRDAYDGLDAGAARAVWPSVDHKALSKAFDRLEQQQLLFDACEISVTGARAAASCRGVASYWPRVGNKARRDEQREWEFKLSKVGDAWRIDSVFAR
jgi:hypothetical protein